MHLPQVGNRLVEVSLPNRWMLEVLIAELGTSLVQSQAISDKCGHFASAYDLYSSYLGVTAQPEIKWDVDTIYFSQGTHTFCLRDFSDSKQEEFSAVLGALAFNDYFNGLDCSGVRLSDSFGLENYLSRLGSLEHLSCVDCGLVVE
uniref:Antirestriction protein n=1 Tax=Macrostomum lignano TaxID=282301 RepID=A0A1I8H323_9PLAT